MLRFHPLFAKPSTDLHPQSGGRADESPPAAENATVAGGSFLPINSPDFPRGRHVILRSEQGREVAGFRDVGFDDWRDAAGNPLDPSFVPVSWRAL